MAAGLKGITYMAKREYGERKTFDEAIAFLRDHGFELLEAPGTKDRFFLKKYNVSAAIEKDPDGYVKIFARPGYLISSEIAKLIDRGYQKFLKTTKTEVPATADHLRAIHDFTEELKEAMGGISIYNEALGTVSDAYVYDRVEDRDEAPGMRPKRPWEQQPPESPRRRA